MEQPTETFNVWEKQAIRLDKPQLIINKFLPKGVVFIPPTASVIMPIFKSDKVDTTITKKEQHLKVVIALSLGVCVVLLFWLMSFGQDKKRAKYYQAPNPALLTKTKSLTITDTDIENTISPANSSATGALPMKPGKGSLKVGDQVSYRDKLIGDELAANQKRNFNTPLLIKADAASLTTGGTLRAPILPIAKNSYVRVYLESEVSSQNLDIPVTAVTYMDLTNNGHLMIPKGAKIIGSAQQVRDGNRVEMRFQYAIFPNGKEYSIRAVALGEDNGAGVEANVDYKLAKKGSSLLAKSLLAAASDTLMVTGGGSFGSAFAGNMAGGSADAMGGALSYESRNNGLTLKVPMNSRFKIVFE